MEHKEHRMLFKIYLCINNIKFSLIFRTPITTGTSVVGIKFDSGVMIASDNLVSYGSLARYQDVQRVFKVNDKTVIVLVVTMLIFNL